MSTQVNASDADLKSGFFCPERLMTLRQIDVNRVTGLPVYLADLEGETRYFGSYLEVLAYAQRHGWQIFEL